MQFTVRTERRRAAVREKEHIQCLLAAQRYVTSCSDASAADETRRYEGQPGQEAGFTLAQLLVLVYLSFQ